LDEETAMKKALTVLSIVHPVIARAYSPEAIAPRDAGKVSAWAAGQLRTRFGDEVQVKYYDPFDADCPPMPANAHLPLVLANGEALTRGGKISAPDLCRKIETSLDKKIA
jgi:hypothetical protein